MSNEDATITVDMDRTCTRCHKPGALPNGLCMTCAFPIRWDKENTVMGEITDEDREALACDTHCAARREPGDCCAIGSVVGAWDKRYTEQWQELEAIQAERDALRQKYHEAMDIMSQWRNIDATAAVAERDTLRAALLATRDHDEPDGSCWCPAGLSSEAGCRHTPRCLQVRAALGVATTPEPTPECDDPHTGAEPTP